MNLSAWCKPQWLMQNESRRITRKISAKAVHIPDTRGLAELDILGIAVR